MISFHFPSFGVIAIFNVDFIILNLDETYSNSQLLNVNYILLLNHCQIHYGKRFFKTQMQYSFWFEFKL
jgi:hypothetical protein